MVDLEYIVFATERYIIMILSTLCYIEKENKYLMLHRVKKEADANKDKWIGVGGKFEDGESPEECVLREVKEETGLTLTKYRFRGIVTFVSDKWDTEYMHLFTATEYEGEDVFGEWDSYNNLAKNKNEFENNPKISDGTVCDDRQTKQAYVCDEGELVWVQKSEIPNLHIWEGDKVFLQLLEEREEFFSLKLRYKGEKLVEVKIT